MDGGRDRSSKASSEEIDSLEPVNDDAGGGGSSRSYDCMYCKRGFSTAQALGGHMNIHRRDRARGRENTNPPPPSFVSTRTDEDHYMNYGGGGGAGGCYFGSYHDLRPFFPVASQPPRGYPFHSSCSTSVAREEKRDGTDDMDPEKLQELIRYGKELELGWKKHVEVEDDDEKTRQGEIDKVDLKLGL